MPRREAVDDVEQVFRKRNINSKTRQGAVATQLAEREDATGKKKPTQSGATWQADLMDMSSRDREAKFMVICVAQQDGVLPAASELGARNRQELRTPREEQKLFHISMLLPKIG